MEKTKSEVNVIVDFKNVVVKTIESRNPTEEDPFYGNTEFYPAFYQLINSSIRVKANEEEFDLIFIMMKINETGFDTRSNSLVYGDELCRSLYHDDEELEADFLTTINKESFLVNLIYEDINGYALESFITQNVDDITYMTDNKEFVSELGDAIRKLIVNVPHLYNAVLSDV